MLHHLAYRAYHKGGRGRTFDGRPMPTMDQLLASGSAPGKRTEELWRVSVGAVEMGIEIRDRMEAMVPGETRRFLGAAITRGAGAENLFRAKYLKTGEEYPENGLGALADVADWIALEHVEPIESEEQAPSPAEDRAISARAATGGRYATVQSFAGQRASVGRGVLLCYDAARSGRRFAPGIIVAIDPKTDQPIVRDLASDHSALSPRYAEARTEGDLDSLRPGEWCWPPIIRADATREPRPPVDPIVIPKPAEPAEPPVAPETVREPAAPETGSPAAQVTAAPPEPARALPPAPAGPPPPKNNQGQNRPR